MTEPGRAQGMLTAIRPASARAAVQQCLDQVATHLYSLSFPTTLPRLALLGLA
jgi:hypothetical protein